MTGEEAAAADRERRREEREQRRQEREARRRTQEAMPPRRPRPAVLRLLAPAALAACLVAVLAVVLGNGALAGGDGAARASDAERRAAPAPGRAERRSVTIGWVGDTVLGSRHGVPADGGRELLRAVRPLLRRPDVMIGNLEGVIGTRGLPKCPSGTPNCFVFQAPPPAAGTLAWAGFDVMNLANNHAYDHGPVGLEDTVAHLDRAKVGHTGRPGQIALVRRNGLTVAVVGFAPYPWAQRLEDLPAAVALVREARRRAQVVVVVMHAGAEGADQVHTPIGEEVAYGERRGNTRAFAHAVIDAGAHAVFGSGPHVVRGVEHRGGRPIVYSTGNFAGYHTFPTVGTMGLSAITRVRIDGAGRVSEGRWIPLRLLPPGRPTRDAARASTVLAAQLSQDDFGAPGLRADGRITAPR